ncbi:uncharacterized protein LOC131876783 [Cryptomeria japonica]|uniref:uncharacterized protein LOC131876783 n=1 Tax=Cryptomeria japonica TaxID=3369 RepID=UPI0027DA8442|nr:uncharacterized protein LOC131876783 [Cryptomeria japonica]
MPPKQQIAKENQELKETLEIERRERREQEAARDREMRQMRRENAALQARLEALERGSRRGPQNEEKDVEANDGANENQNEGNGEGELDPEERRMTPVTRDRRFAGLRRTYLSAESDDTIPVTAVLAPRSTSSALHPAAGLLPPAALGSSRRLPTPAAPGISSFTARAHVPPRPRLMPPHWISPPTPPPHHCCLAPPPQAAPPTGIPSGVLRHVAGDHWPTGTFCTPSQIPYGRHISSHISMHS